MPWVAGANHRSKAACRTSPRALNDGVRMVEYIEGFNPKFEVNPFANGKALVESHIEGDFFWSPNAAWLGVSKFAKSGRLKRCRAQIACGVSESSFFHLRGA